MIIKSVEIEGFWGKYKARSDFYQDVTIFIGFNGTGKTTFINLIVAVLSIDIQQLENLQFNSINIILIDPKNKNSRRTINVLREQNEQSSLISIFKYKIGNKVYRIFGEVRYRRVGSDKEVMYRMPSSVREQYMDLKQELSSLVEISQISVYRQSTSETMDIDPRQRTTAVDDRLQQLLHKFAIYQLKLEAQLNEESKLFQKETIASLLYNEEFDKFDENNLDNIAEIDLNTEENKLSRAFEELGIKGKTNQIKNHINKLRDAIQGLKEALSEGKKDIAPADVFALPLISRTNKIIDLLNSSEEAKKKIAEPRQKFFDTLQEFMRGKKFRYDNKTSRFTFFLDKDNSINLELLSLSSGEKQLLIQFIEVLLQERKSTIFIADEPELSLHVTWQEKLLKALRELNNNAQLIVATHSPDIVADFRNNVINMEEVVNVH
ncbi:AAA family ATPase [Komarekiella sp. 'clone 1']|uniref:AAA family ATPase n=1 Tax=Komarekiella delphini-convector SJRDD-AB1 TaxID=2593771 RepID=A0AA40SY88_9NOST|nr:AAA family ATPase [Komarekiella delphini-convector]MBD6617513.1 AAA family ATPase [Komarekiella delphini-convector SJRDD-AB1]